MSHALSARVTDALSAFAQGDPVLIHDAAEREGETDLMYPAAAVTPEAIARLRNDAGGLVCVAIPGSVADAFDLPFLQHVLDHPATEDHELVYDDRSSFSLSVNHRDTHTGITDRDRALTVTELARATAASSEADFADRFRAPGHVHVLRGADGGLDDRHGHTELGIALAKAADITPAVVLCEMLDDESGVALSPAAARRYADRTGTVYLEGADLLESM